MHSTSISSWHTCCYNPVPSNLFSPKSNPHHHSPSKITLRRKHRHFRPTNLGFIALTSTYSCCKERETKKNHIHQDNICSSIQDQEPSSDEKEDDNGWGILSNMGWADLRAAFGQRINMGGIACFFGILAKDKQLAISHVTVPDIRYIDWVELKNWGFQGVVFDKDNTITVPYSLSLWAPLGPAIQECKSVFGSNIAVFSNSAGLFEYDPDGRKARALEQAIGIRVIKHKAKKPLGTAEEIEKHFGCESSKLIMVGDRPFTDIVYGNKNGFFTILTEPLSCGEEPLIVGQVRRFEVTLITQWSKKGILPRVHKLFSDPKKCVKDAPM